MGHVKPLNPILLSYQDVVMESGKMLKVFWKDKTINAILERMED